MKRRVVWAGRGLAVLGLAAVVGAVLHATTWAFVAAAGGFLAATGLALAPLARAWVSGEPQARPIDPAHALDLLRQAYGARAGWAVGQGDQDLEVVEEALDRGARQRGVAIVHLASIDGRAHVARESEGTYVAVGDFPFGAGLLLPNRTRRPSRLRPSRKSCAACSPACASRSWSQPSRRIGSSRDSSRRSPLERGPSRASPKQAWSWPSSSASEGRRW